MRRSRWAAKFWGPMMAEAGFPAGRFTLHSLRHFFATILIFAKANVKVVQLAMGHAKPSITLDTYTGYWPDEAEDRSRSLVDAALGTICSESVENKIH